MFLAQAIGRRQGGEGLAGILVITPLTSAILDQISMGLSACNLSVKISTSVDNAATEIILARRIEEINIWLFLKKFERSKLVLVVYRCMKTVR